MAYTTADLVNFLNTIHGANIAKAGNLDIKYVLYARKSSESEEKQVRSLGDQITECRKLISDRNLHIINPPILESESAKEPDIRPKFRQMIEDIKSGKYDGIVAWHPDRLARNMKDAGEIIDLLDKKIIKDLQFVSFTFENNTAGKMLLGIAFVLSKQYSDQLSDNVLRGIRRSIEEGKYINKRKHGYLKDVNQYLRPDGDNFHLIKKAWKMRIEGIGQKEIAEYLNSSHYTMAKGIGGGVHSEFVFDKKRISELFRDPIYCGVLLYGKKQRKIVDLTQVYEFIPMVSVDEFLAINKITNFDKYFKQRFKTEVEGRKASLLNGKVLCGYCHHPMVSAITPKRLKDGSIKHYYNYRCDNQSCHAKLRAVRAHVVEDYLINYLREHKFTSKDVYEHYVEEMKDVIKAQEEILESEYRSLIRGRTEMEDKIDKEKNLLLQEADIQVRDTFKEDLKKHQQEVLDITEAIEKIRQEKQKHKQAILTYSEFLELFSKLPNLIKQTKVLKEKDYLLSKIYLNCIIKDKKVLSVQLNPPFDRFVKVAEVSNGRDDRT